MDTPYNTIVNPKTGKNVKSGGKIGKSLINDYRYNTIVNPVTKKEVKTSGSVGKKVLDNYKNSVYSTQKGGDVKEIRADYYIKKFAYYPDDENEDSIARGREQNLYKFIKDNSRESDNNYIDVSKESLKTECLGYIENILGGIYEDPRDVLEVEEIKQGLDSKISEIIADKPKETRTWWPFSSTTYTRYYFVDNAFKKLSDYLKHEFLDKSFF